MKKTNRISLPWMTALCAAVLALATGPAYADDGKVEHDLAEGRSPTRRHHRRMALEMTGLFTAGNRWYWRDGGKPNEVDWQLPAGAPAIQSKLGSLGGWRFDGNPYDINALGHPAFGMLTHFLARENGYGVGESFLISTLASGTWEVFLEWREYGSLNDLAATSPAGVPLGEAAYQMISHAREVHVDVRSGVGSENGATVGVLRVQGELDRIPDRGTGSFRGGRKVGVAAELPGDGQGARGYVGGARSTVAGWYRNRGDRRLVAAAIARYDYRKQAERPERQWDLLTSVAVGPSVEYRIRQGGLTLEVATDLCVAFGMLKAQGFDAWRADHPTMTMRNVMANREHPYYFGGGAVVDPRLRLSYGRYFAGARLSGAMYSSFDGADRDQEMLTDKVHFVDRDTNAQAAVGYSYGRVSLMVDGRVHRRSGTAGGVGAATGERTAMLTVGLHR